MFRISSEAVGTEDVERDHVSEAGVSCVLRSLVQLLTPADDSSRQLSSSDHLSDSSRPWRHAAGEAASKDSVPEPTGATTVSLP